MKIKKKKRKTQKRKRTKAANESRRKTSSLQFNITQKQVCNFKHMNRGAEFKDPFKPLN